MDLKNRRRGRIREYADAFRADYLEGQRPWRVPCDCAFPSATQNEINAKDAENLLKGGVYVVSEGANMPTTPEGVNVFLVSPKGPGYALRRQYQAGHGMPSLVAVALAPP